VGRGEESREGVLTSTTLNHKTAVEQTFIHRARIPNYKSEGNGIVQSVNDIVQSVNDIVQSVNDIVQSVNDIVQSVNDIVQSVKCPPMICELLVRLMHALL